MLCTSNTSPMQDLITEGVSRHRQHQSIEARSCVPDTRANPSHSGIPHRMQTSLHIHSSEGTASKRLVQHGSCASNGGDPGHSCYMLYHAGMPYFRKWFETK